LKYDVRFICLVGVNESGLLTPDTHIPGTKVYCFIKIYPPNLDIMDVLFDGDKCFEIPKNMSYDGNHPISAQYYLQASTEDLEFIRKEVSKSFQF